MPTELMDADLNNLLDSSQQSGRLERLACWFGASLASAFFASLESCSCIKLNTIDFEEDEEANDKPLITLKREPVEQERLKGIQVQMPAWDGEGMSGSSFHRS
eukprot:c18878_g1_i1 orf=451-759(-)